MLKPKTISKSIDDCLGQATSLATYVLSSSQSIRDSVFLHQIGRIPRKTLEERLEEMSEGERYAVELIGKIGTEHGGLFADFPQPEPRKKPRPEMPSGIPSVETMPKIKPLPPPKIPKEEIKTARELANCIARETGNRTNWSELKVKKATALCLCGEKI